MSSTSNQTAFSVPPFHAEADLGCRDADPELFWPVSNPHGGYPTKAALARIDKAKAVCWGCPYRAECAMWALDNRVQDGIWGATTGAERRRHWEGRSVV